MGELLVLKRRHGVYLMIVPGYVYEIHGDHAIIMPAEDAKREGYEEEALLAQRMRDKEESCKGEKYTPGK